MNKKAQIELADLAGFILIFVAIIIFGYIFIELSPKAHIEILNDESPYITKYELLSFLDYETEGKSMADLISLAVENNDFVKLDKNVLNYFTNSPGYLLIIYKNSEFFSYYTNMDLNEDFVRTMIYGKTDFEFDVHSLVLNNFYKDDIRVELNMLRS